MVLLYILVLGTLGDCLFFGLTRRPFTKQSLWLAERDRCELFEVRSLYVFYIESCVEIYFRRSGSSVFSGRASVKAKGDW